ncbi:uncharacterized protein LOC142337472 isoform X3 [Convolutriloba macropyga]|uniref:uncharacterized protein LOC142337472 isoform X3 n=1 Tax=Convolutriloba macropyga TaxID=536237 RepID=UPI003F52702E
MMTRDADESNDDEFQSKRTKKKKKERNRKPTKGHKSHGKGFLDEDELGRILGPPSQRTGGKKRHSSEGNTPKLSGSHSNASLLSELSGIYYDVQKQHSRTSRGIGSTVEEKENAIEKDMFLKIRAKFWGYNDKPKSIHAPDNFSLYEFGICLEHDRTEFNNSLSWLRENELNSSNCSPLLSVTRQLSRLSSPSLSQQSSVQLFSHGSSENCVSDISCPKLLSGKIEEIKEAYIKVSSKVDSFYTSINRLYSSSISWMDLTYFKWTEAERASFLSRIQLEDSSRRTCSDENSNSLQVAILRHESLLAIQNNLESINSWCYFTYAALEKLHTIGKLISNSETSAFLIADLKSRSHDSSSGVSPEDVSRSYDIQHFDLDEQLKLFAETNADYASILQFETWREQKSSERDEKKGPLMLVKSKLHELLLKMRDALIIEVGSDNDLNLRFNYREESTKVTVLSDNCFSFFDFTEFAEQSPQSSLLKMFDRYLQEVCTVVPVTKSRSSSALAYNYRPPIYLPSLLYLYVYLLRVERSICAFQILGLEKKLGLIDYSSSGSGGDRVGLENKVRSLVNIILIAVSEKVYVSKLIMPFIGNLEFEAQMQQRPDLFTETYQYEVLLRKAFSQYSSYFYRNFTRSAATSSSSPENPSPPGTATDPNKSFSISPSNTTSSTYNNSSRDDDSDGLLLFDKSFAIYHWRFTCKVLPYIAGGCHQSVDAFRRAIMFYLGEISRQLTVSKENFKMTVEIESYHEESWSEVMKLHGQLKAYQLCLRNVTSFTRQVLEDLSICSLLKVRNVEKFFCAIKDTHTLIEIHDRYLNPSEFDTHVNNQPACYLVHRRLTNQPNLLKDLLLAIVNVRNKSDGSNIGSEFYAATRDSNSSSEKTEMFRSRVNPKVNCPFPSLTNLDSHPLIPMGPRFCSTLKSTPEVNSITGQDADQTPTITPFETTAVENTDSSDSKTNSIERSYSNPDAYLLMLNPRHIGTWKKMFEHEKPQSANHKMTVLPPFYSFLPELTPMCNGTANDRVNESPERSAPGSMFDLSAEDDGYCFRSLPRSEQILDPSEMIVVSFSNSVAKSLLDSAEFKSVSVKATQVPRYKSTRAEFESLYSSGLLGDTESESINNLLDDDVDEAEVGSSSGNSGTTENALCDELTGSLTFVDRPILLSLFEEIVDHLEASVKVVNNYMESYKLRHKYPLGNKHSGSSTTAVPVPSKLASADGGGNGGEGGGGSRSGGSNALFSHCAKYLNILTLMAVQYAKDISIIIPASGRSRPRERLSGLCLRLFHVLINYVIDILNVGPGQRSKRNSAVFGYIKLVAEDSISQFFTAEQKEHLKDEAKKMFESIVKQNTQYSRKMTSSKSNNTDVAKRSRREVRKQKSVAKSGITNLRTGNLEAFYDSADSFPVAQSAREEKRIDSFENFDAVDGERLIPRSESYVVMGSKKEDFDQFRERSNTAAGDGGEQQQILPQRSSMLLDANGNIDAYGDADGNSSVCLDLDQDQEYWSSTSEEDKSRHIGPLRKRLETVKKERNSSVMFEIARLEEQITAKKAETTGRIVNKPTTSVAARILGYYVNFEFKTGRYIPKSSKSVSEAIKKGSDLTMAVKKVRFEMSSFGKEEGTAEPFERSRVKDYVDSLSSSVRKEFETSISEVEQLMKLRNCEYVVTFYGVAIGEGYIYICMELFEQSLNTLATTRHKEATFSAMDFQIILHQVVQALKYIHSRNVIHMDVKAENIFLKEVYGKGHNYYLAKLGDFGLTIKNGIKTTGLGTPGFFALELFENTTTNVSSKCDIWSLGCTVLQVFCNVVNPLRYFAFGTDGTEEGPLNAEDHGIGTCLAFYILGHGHVYLPPIDAKKGISHDCVNFMELCLQTEPAKRPTAAQLSCHPFVS